MFNFFLHLVRCPAPADIVELINFVKAPSLKADDFDLPHLIHDFGQKWMLVSEQRIGFTLVKEQQQ